MQGQWIWLNDGLSTENERGCFVRRFSLSAPPAEATLAVSADTRYIAYLNGREIGRGPLRGLRSHWFYDSFDVAPLLRAGENLLALRVWNYGWSSYQSIASEGGLIFDLRVEGRSLVASDEKVRCRRDAGYESFMVKRNVNLGFSDYYDARLFDFDWIDSAEASRDWQCARAIPDIWGELMPSPIAGWDAEYRRPRSVSRAFLARNDCQQISVNTRRAFFGDRRDADETIFTGFMAVVLVAPRAMEGRIIFPNRTWNGLLGDFKIDGKLYPVSNARRDIPVGLAAGRQLLLIQFSGKYDDLYCHLEFVFPEELGFEDADGGREAPFWVIGPTQRILSKPDGFQKVYGGLDEYNRVEENTKEHDSIFACESLEKLLAFREKFVPVEKRYVWRDEYLLSVARHSVPVKEFPVDGSYSPILWDNDRSLKLDVPPAGAHHALILDFGDICAGSPEFTLQAAAGTILQLYGFENMFGGEIDYTIGLNNGLRYICREGWQSYRAMARLGLRYALLLIKNQTGPVKLRALGMRALTRGVSNIGSFRSSDDTLNRVFEMCRRTGELCVEDTFTDSPTWEQAYWIGDAQISSFLYGWLYGDAAYLRHNIEIAATALQNTPLMNALTPTDWNTAIPMWAFNWIVSIKEYAHLTGDHVFPARLYPLIAKVLKYYAGFVTAEGGFLINGWNMLDWAALDICNHCVVTGQQALLAWCMEYASGLAENLGRAEEAGFFRDGALRLRRYIDRALWREDRQAFADGWSPENGLSRTLSVQTHTLLQLFDGILDDEKARKTRAYLLRLPEDFIRVGSPFFLFYQYEALSRLGRTEEIFRDVRARWGEMLRCDSTTCWEVFPGFYENSRTRSYCHAWSASPAYFMLKLLLGVECAADGFACVRLRIGAEFLSWCEGRVPTPHGAIEIRWSREGGRKRCHVRIPAAIRLETEALDGWELSVERI